MKLKELFEVVPEIMIIKLIQSQLDLVGTMDSMQSMLHDNIMNCEIDSIEPRSDELWVWLK